MCFGVDANGSCVDSWTKEVNMVMFMEIPLWTKGENCTSFAKSKNLLTLQMWHP
jgi:hypothetical protein